MVRKLCFASLFAVSACGSGMSGEYGGENCIYDKIAFGSGDTVYFTMLGVEQAGTYRIDGDRVILTAGTGQSIVFTKNGRNLEAAALGEKMTCSKL